MLRRANYHRLRRTIWIVRRSLRWDRLRLRRRIWIVVWIPGAFVVLLALATRLRGNTRAPGRRVLMRVEGRGHCLPRKGVRRSPKSDCASDE